MSDDPAIVEIRFDDIFWSIHVEKTDRTEYGKPVIGLSWGWTAGMTKEEIASFSDDSPTGHKTIYILLDQAIDLRDKLDEIIKQNAS